MELRDLNKFRTAPHLNSNQSKKLLDEITFQLTKADWFTIGVMAKTDIDAIRSLKTFIKFYSIIDFQNFEDLRTSGGVFLKGNQKTGNVYIRSENGLGEGILLTCQYDDKSLPSMTYGPFPLDFFN